jgi:hypothetical protein
MMELIFFPSPVPAEISALSISPVERCLRLNSAASFTDCVPLPDPGGPKIKKLIIEFVLFINIVNSCFELFNKSIH